MQKMQVNFSLFGSVIFFNIRFQKNMEWNGMSNIKGEKIIHPSFWEGILNTQEQEWAEKSLAKRYFHLNLLQPF